jgi:transposase
MAAKKFNTSSGRSGYDSDVSDQEWEFCCPYLVLMDPQAPQRTHDLRQVFNALRYMVRNGCRWRALPNDLPPWEAVYQQGQRWMKAGCFEAMAHDLRQWMRLALERNPQPTTTILDGRTMQSTPESGARSGYDGYKRRKGSKVHMAVDTLGHLLALTVTPADAQERSQVAPLAEQIQQATGQNVEVAYVDQGYTGENPLFDAAEKGIDLVVVRLPGAKKGFVLLPRRWVVERSFAWLSRFRRLARDYERLPGTLAQLHWLAFSCLMLNSLSRLSS